MGSTEGTRVRLELPRLLKGPPTQEAAGLGEGGRVEGLQSTVGCQVSAKLVSLKCYHCTQLCPKEPLEPSLRLPQPAASHTSFSRHLS